MTAGDLAAVNERIEQAIGDLDAHPDADVAPRVHALVRDLCDLFGAGLARVLSVAGAHPGAGQPLVMRMAQDPLISSLLLLTDQHPQDAAQRVETAIERLRPLAAMRGASVTLLDVNDGRARLRVVAVTPAGSQAAADVERDARAAIEAAAPEIADLEFERTAEPLPLIQIARSRPDALRQATHE